MLALALHIDPTAERQAPWQPTLRERCELLFAMERYAAAVRLPDPDTGMSERLAASEDANRIITRVAMRACEEMTNVSRL